MQYYAETYDNESKNKGSKLIYLLTVSTNGVKIRSLSREHPSMKCALFVQFRNIQNNGLFFNFIIFVNYSKNQIKCLIFIYVQTTCPIHDLHKYCDLNNMILAYS